MVAGRNEASYCHSIEIDARHSMTAPSTAADGKVRVYWHPG